MLIVAPCLHGADGVSLVSRQWIRALAAMGCNVRTWMLADVDRADLIDVPSRVDAYRARGRAHLVMYGLWSSCRQRFDQLVVTHLHMLPVVAGHLVRGARLTVCLHGVECWKPIGGVRQPLLARADTLCAVSSYTASRFVAANPRFADRVIHICPPAVPQDIAGSELPTRKTVLVVARLSSEERYKGHDALLNVWPSIAAAIPEAQLVFVGDGNDRARLEARIRNEKLSSSVQSLGLLTRAQLRQAYAACRVFALPSSGEGFGIVFLEAMAAGRPCVASSGGAEDVVEPGRTGLLVPPGDEDALREAIVRLLTDDELCLAMGRAGQLRARHDFSQASLTERLSRAIGVEHLSRPVGC